MAGHVFSLRTRVRAPADEVFAWHERQGALERLTPPWQGVRVLERSGSVRDGDRVVLSVGVGPLRRRWVAEHRDHVPGRSFRDVQLEGPFKRWEHSHIVEPDGPAACFLEDRIEFDPPLGALLAPVSVPIVRAQLERAFNHRHRTLVQDFEMHASPAQTRMKVAITGASGLIGSQLTALLQTGGHDVARLVRSKSDPAAGAFLWDPDRDMIDARAFDGADAVVHLSGESVAGRWSDDKKRRILDSRVRSTGLLGETLAGLERPPRVLICASAVGYYGDRGDEELTEESPPGEGFLADVVRRWEAAASPAADAGLRVVNLRFGIVLSPAGGALRTMLPAFRLGAGGRLGSGRQFMSWIAIDDAVGSIHHALTKAELSGPVNAVAPNPVRNAEFSKTLARVLRRPGVLAVPGIALAAALGEAAQELLGSQRALPAKLEQSGYRFRAPQLEDALRHVLGK